MSEVRAAALGASLQLADVDRAAAVIAGTTPPPESRWDWSSASQAKRSEAAFAAMLAIDATDAVEGRDDVLRHELLSHLAARYRLLADGELARSIEAGNTPLHQILNELLLTRQKEHEDLGDFSRLLASVPTSLRSWRSGLRDTTVNGQAPSAALVAALATEIDTSWNGVFTNLATAVARASFSAEPDQLLAAGEAADVAVSELGAWLETELFGRADRALAIGPARFPAWWTFHAGSDLDAPAIEAVIVAAIAELRQTIASLASLEREGRTLDAPEGAGATARATAVLAGQIADLERRAGHALDGLRQLTVVVNEGQRSISMAVGSTESGRPGILWLPHGAGELPWSELAPGLAAAGVPGALWLDAATPDRAMAALHHLIGGRTAKVGGWSILAGVRSAPQAGTLAAELGQLHLQLGNLVFGLFDLGFHLGRAVPVLESAFDGKAWSVDVATELVSSLTGWSAERVSSEVQRTLSAPAAAASAAAGFAALADTQASHDLFTFGQVVAGSDAWGLDELANLGHS